MKTLYTIVLALLGCSLAYGQQGGISAGIKGGANWSCLDGKDLDRISSGGNAKALCAPLLGLTLNNKVSRHVWLKHELFYSLRRLSIQADDSSNPVFASTIKRGYIDLFPASVVIHYKGLQVYAGPYLGILLSASIQRKDAAGRLYTDKSFFGDDRSPGNYCQKFDAGFVAGIEYEFPAGLNIGARYVHGLVPVLENSATAQQWRICNQGFAFTMGYTVFKD